MVKVIFLNERHLDRIRPHYEVVLPKGNSLVLERGYIAFGEELNEPYCQFILQYWNTGLKGPRYKIEATAAEFERTDKKGTELMPKAILKSGRYVNFGFAPSEEMRIYNQLKHYYLNGSVNGEDFNENAQLVGMTREELKDKIVRNPNLNPPFKESGGFIGALLGFCIGYIIAQEQGASPGLTLAVEYATTVAGGFLFSSLPEIEILARQRQFAKEIRKDVIQHTGLEGLL